MKRLLLFLLAATLVASARADFSKVLVYGKVLSATDTGLLVSCEPATHSHPTGSYNIAASSNRIVHVAGDAKALVAMGLRGIVEELKVTRPETGLVVFVARDSSEKYTYTTKAGSQNTVPNFTAAEDLPHYSQIMPARASAAPPGAIAAANVERSQFGTVMELPRNNLDTEIKDLRIGTPAEKVLRILGNPLHVNGSQWVYGGGYIYVDNGVVTAMQNKSGDVFDASWKR